MQGDSQIIERILYLDGVPNLQRMNPVRVGEGEVGKEAYLAEQIHE